MNSISSNSFRHARKPRLLAAGMVFLWTVFPASLIAEDAGEPMPPLPAQTAGEEASPETELRAQQDRTRAELEAIAKSMSLSDEKVRSLQDNINSLEQTTATLREKVIESAARRRQFEDNIAAGSKRLAGLETRQTALRASLHERRALLAEVLAALQRMGRNPPPALLVTPDDALSSVRSAILLGAVVPGMRHQTEILVGDLEKLGALKREIVAEREKLTADMTNRLEEERRMDLLIARNLALSAESAEALALERRKAEELATRANSMDELISTLEREIASVRQAAEAERQASAARERLSEAERKKQEELALANPDENRIAPAVAFSSLKSQLRLPVSGDVLRRFGDDDGTGHPARGITVATDPGALVTAPADGHVVFAGQFRSYGQMIILNTGDGYHLLLTGMDAVKTAPGKFVLAGEPLANMGEKRVASATALALETDRPTLYIEFRKDGKPVDSQSWWTAKDIGKAHNDT